MHALLAFAGVLLLAATTLGQTCSAQGFSNDALCNSWLINHAQTSPYFSGALVEVQDAAFNKVNGQSYIEVSSHGIPLYQHMMTAKDITFLESRPHASFDLTSGRPTTAAGQTVAFGESIGYKSDHCSLGYWPPGPSCPAVQQKSVRFPMLPIESNKDCYTTLSEIGMWVNGVSVFNWWDGQSYQNANTWHTIAAQAEWWDVDLCSGHATQQGDYHHHTYPNCLSERLEANETTAKSGIWGWAADGFPILGPYAADGVLAKSCWRTRDYSAKSATGCGQEGVRSCLMVDQYDPSLGVMKAAHSGPTTWASVTSMSGNPLNATSGLYFEDFYYDRECTAMGDAYLDDHNGRMDPEYGYVYHATVEQLPAPEAIPVSVFPYFLGPRFYGALDSNTIAQCTTSMFSGAGGGGGGKPPAGPARNHR